MGVFFLFLHNLPVFGWCISGFAYLGVLVCIVFFCLLIVLGLLQVMAACLCLAGSNVYTGND